MYILLSIVSGLVGEGPHNKPIGARQFENLEHDGREFGSFKQTIIFLFASNSVLRDKFAGNGLEMRVERAGQIQMIYPLETYFHVIWKQMIADATFVSYWNKSLLAMKYLSDIMISEKSQMGKVWLFSVLRISRLGSISSWREKFLE